MVFDLQHEVHYLNNQLHPLLDEEEEDPKMLVEDDGWEEEEVDLEDEDDAISDLDSEHTIEQSHLGTSQCASCIPAIYVMELQFEFQYSLLNFSVILALCMSFHYGLNFNEIPVLFYWWIMTCMLMRFKHDK